MRSGRVWGAIVFVVGCGVSKTGAFFEAKKDAGEDATPSTSDSTQPQDANDAATKPSIVSIDASQGSISDAATSACASGVPVCGDAGVTRCCTTTEQCCFDICCPAQWECTASGGCHPHQPHVVDAGPPQIVTHSLVVRAYIDGRSALKIQGSLARWHHYEHNAPGREGVRFEPTWLGATPWLPTWPDFPTPLNNFCDCDSSSVAAPNVAKQAQFARIVDSAGRGGIYLSQPTAANGYTLTITFDDNSDSGADWYDVRLSYEGEGP